jgi:hypothetical protein
LNWCILYFVPAWQRWSRLLHFVSMVTGQSGIFGY